ncbi:AlbA family DNA-binding domain-containing protein [Nocardia rhamnosiphila]
MQHAVRWDASKSALVDQRGRIVAKVTRLGEVSAVLKDILHLSAGNISIVLKECLDDQKRMLEGELDRTLDDRISLDSMYDAEEIGIRRSVWSANYPGMDTDILLLHRTDEELQLSFELIVPTKPVWEIEDILSALGPHLEAANMRVISGKIYPQGDSSRICEVVVEPPSNATVREMAYMTSTLRDLLMNGSSGATPESVFRAVESGEVQFLLGVAESETLDAKRAHYTKGDDRKRLEIASDVAAFANSQQGGVIVIGARTVKDPHGRDIIAEVGGCPIDKGAEDRYRKAISDLIFPEVEGIEICRSVSPLGELFAILIPVQSPDRIPFFVRGGGIGDARASSAMFQVPVRRGASNPSSVRVEEIHRMLRRMGDDTR